MFVKYAFIYLFLLFFKYLSTREAGVHYKEIAQQLNLPEQKVMYLSLSLSLVRALTYFASFFFVVNGGTLDRDVAKVLEEEGLVYSTIDENHLKSASNG